MKERPILFSAPMVRALLSGAKTQTRRGLSVQPTGAPYAAQASLTKSGSRPVFYAAWERPGTDGSTCCICPYGVPGDRLWVREAWRTCEGFDVYPPRDIQRTTPVRYEADSHWSHSMTGGGGKLRPSMFMPRWASRILLEVTDVRVERLQDISEADALAEGTPSWADGACAVGNPHGLNARDYYEVLWSSINGRASWDANPWVWCVSFRRIGP